MRKITLEEVYNYRKHQYLIWSWTDENGKKWFDFSEGDGTGGSDLLPYDEDALFQEKTIEDIKQIARNWHADNNY